MNEPLLIGAPTNDELTSQLLSPVWRPTSRLWIGALGCAALGSGFFLCLIVYTVWDGIGLWGNNIPVGWGFGIINFVFWIELAHAGTFISAVLLLLEQRWRTSINRIAEAMTLFAVMQAMLFPCLHLGRPWFAYWLIPYPATMAVWPNFKSSLPWDAAAVSTYAFVSLLFWYIGLIPDFATLRDRAPGRLRRKIYGVLAFGWQGSVRHQRIYRIAYGLMAGMVTALVISVISVISTDFTIAIEPGWHSTIFPPYFVAAALYSGFAGVTTLLILVRALFGMRNVITVRHLDILGKMLLVTGTLTLYCYIIEFFTAWYSGDAFERYTYFHQFWWGPNAWVWWLTLACTLASQLFFVGKIRRNAVILFVLSIAINVGMWSDRFSFIVLSLERDFLPSSWHVFSPTWVDWGLLAGSVSFFSFLFLLFIRYLPFIPLSEMKKLGILTLRGRS